MESLSSVNKSDIFSPVSNSENESSSFWWIIAIIIILVIFVFLFMKFGIVLLNLVKQEKHVTFAPNQIVSIPNNDDIDINEAATSRAISTVKTNQNQSLNDILQQAGDHMEHTYTSDDSYSNIQTSKATSKSGWCYIGEDRGFRSCINIGDNSIGGGDKCMSGDIFPTQNLCINPKLRF